MHGDWPHEEIIIDINHVMGIKQGDGKSPQERLASCTLLSEIILREAGLADMPGPSRTRTVHDFLKSAIAQYAEDHHFLKCREVAAARELLGFTSHSPEQLRRIFEEEDHGLDVKVIAAGYDSKLVRLYLAGRELRTPLKSRAAQNRQREFAVAVAEGLYDLFEHHPDRVSDILARIDGLPVEGKTAEQPSTGFDVVPPDTDFDGVEALDTDTRFSTTTHAAASHRRRLRTSVIIATSATLAIATTITTIIVLERTERTSSGASSIASSVNPSPVPASSSSPPVLVENVSPMTSNLGGYPSLVLPSKLAMTATQLDMFDTQIYPQSSRYASWYRDHDGSALDFGEMTITLGGNAKEKVRITDLQVDKKCHPPLGGTYFAGYSQGEGDNIRIAFDLDSPDPSAQEMAYLSTGPVATGDNFFQLHTVDLAPGEKQTVTVGAITSKYSCSFTLRLIVATSSGSYWEKIDNDGKPFQVTAMAPATNTAARYSGYKSCLHPFNTT